MKRTPYEAKVDAAMDAFVAAVLRVARQHLDAASKASRRGKLPDFRRLRREVLRRFESDYVATALRAAEGNMSQAARLAGIDRKHLWRLMRRRRA